MVKVLYVPAYEIGDIAFFVNIAETRYYVPSEGMKPASSRGNFELLSLFSACFQTSSSFPENALLNKL